MTISHVQYDTINTPTAAAAAAAAVVAAAAAVVAAADSVMRMDSESCA